MGKSKKINVYGKSKKVTFEVLSIIYTELTKIIKPISELNHIIGH